MSERMNTVVIFGGTGFIGTHLAQHWLRENLAEKIVLADLNPPRTEPYTAGLQAAISDGRVNFIECDVRNPIQPKPLPGKVDLIFNLAAIHREPGHKPDEYFETNIQGAANVCAWATAEHCNKIVFTSSISPYGPSEEVKNEDSVPAPETPYGSSKLTAERIHREWQEASSLRKLLILRPGVVFGPGEGGNVTRLVRSVVKGYFFYMGNKHTRKAGGYVKELCHATHFAMDDQDRNGDAFTLVNFSLSPAPALEDYVRAIQNTCGLRRHPLSVPRSLLLGASYPISAAADALGIQQPINPVRIRKLYRSTSIDPKRLRDLGYCWKYTLDEAFADWMRDLPEDFER